MAQISETHMQKTIHVLQHLMKIFGFCAQLISFSLILSILSFYLITLYMHIYYSRLKMHVISEQQVSLLDNVHQEMGHSKELSAQSWANLYL